MSDHQSLGETEAAAFKAGLTIHDPHTRQRMAAERLTSEMIEIKFLLRALLEKGSVNVGSPRQEE